MAGIVDELVSYGSDFKDLEDEQAARSVVVTNIPDEAREEDIIIHFQKRKHGGGDIDNLHIIENSTTAVVTFDSDEVAKSVLEKPQCLKGTELDLKPYPKSPAEIPKVFSRVSARIEPDECRVSPRVLRENLEKVEAEMTTVKHHEASDCFIVSGSFEEIRKYRELLQTFLKKGDQSGRQSGDFNSQNIGDGSETEDSKTERSETKAAENNAEILEVVPKFMKLLQRAYKRNLDAVESRCLVELAWHEGSDKVEIKRRPGCSDRQHKEGLDSFINLYQKLYPDMAQEVVELHVKDAACIEKAASKISKKLAVFIERSNDKWSVYGEKSIIPGAVRQLKEELGLIARNVKSSGRQWDDQTAVTLPNKDEAQRFNPASSRKCSASFGPVQHEMSNGVKISVLQGDICLQRVDAIVNAANEYLVHGGGVAGAIVKGGGFQIQEESRRIISYRGRVQVGTAVHTAAGNLPCKVVIHAVGPRWSDQNKENEILLLRSACISSLRLAASLRMTSIALPAISSGIFGMPKELCAKTMFEAVHEFSESVDCKLSSLRDVQFVNIDDETVMVFQKEFANRYGPSIRSNRNEHSTGAMREDSRGNLSLINTNKPLPSERANQATATVGTSKPGHVERINCQNTKEEISSKTPKLDGHQASSNDAHSNFEEYSHGSKSGVEDGKTRSGRDDSGRGDGMANTEFSRKKKDDNKNSNVVDPADALSTTANTRASALPASNSSSNGPGTQVGLFTTTKTGETSKSSEIKATNANYNQAGARHVKTAAGSGQGRVSGQKDVRHSQPPGLASSKEGQRFAEQFSNNANNQNLVSREKLNQDSPNPKNTGGTEDESRLSEMSVQTDSPIKPSSFPGREEDESLTTITTSPSADNTGVYNKTPLPQNTKGNEELDNQADAGHLGEESHQHFKEEDGDRSSEIAKPDKQQAFSNALPQHCEGYNHTKSRNNSDRSKGTAHGEDQEDGGSTRKITEPSDVIVRSSPGSEDDCSLPTLPTAYNIPLPDDPETTNELALPGQSNDAPEEPPPLEDENSPQMAGGSGQKLSDHDVHMNKVPSLESKKIDGTSGESEDSVNRQPGLATIGAAEVKTFSEGDRETYKPDEATRCFICFEHHKNPKDLPDCGHRFCEGCIEKELKTRSDCPKCAFQSTHRAVADQPLGYMSWTVEEASLPGFEDCGTIVIKYHIPDGIQGKEHPNPGKAYVGVERTAYLPNSEEGKEVLTLLKQAFDARLVFTLNKRPTEEGKNLVIWNKIHHKTKRRNEGPTNDGYPDAGYLSRVKQDLAVL